MLRLIIIIPVSFQYPTQYDRACDKQQIRRNNYQQNRKKKGFQCRDRILCRNCQIIGNSQHNKACRRKKPVSLWLLLPLRPAVQQLDRIRHPDLPQRIQQDQSKNNGKKYDCFQYGTDFYRKCIADFSAEHLYHAQFPKLRKQNAKAKAVHKRNSKHQSTLTDQDSGNIPFPHAKDIVKSKFPFSAFYQK